jgi:hypothetical protein
MTRPSVTMIEGRHLTAADKRNILASIEYLRGVPDRAVWLGRPGSPKRYCLAPVEGDPARYRVVAEETYRSDAGQRRTRQSRFLIEVQGIDPLPPGDWSGAQRDLFAEAGA